MSDNATKEHIINRLHERCGICSYCGKKGCGHSNTNLPPTFSRQDVLWAVNLDNYFEQDKQECRHQWVTNGIGRTHCEKCGVDSEDKQE